jgi:DNA ligase (NAD+)
MEKTLMAPQNNSGLICRLALTGRLVLMSWLLPGSTVIGSLPAVSAENPAVDAVKQLSPAGAAERIDALRTEIAYHDELYFKKSAPVISDHAYDQLKRELAALVLSFPEAARDGTALPGMGDDRSGQFPTYRHRERMLSLNKSYTEVELRAFDARLRRQLGRGELEYVVEPKFDGLAISVTYEKGKLVRAVTRGNGTEGDDVTANALTIRLLPQTLRAVTPEGVANPVPELVELRGEIYLPYAEFARINRERESAGEAPFAHPRNLAAGTLKEFDARETARRRLAIVFYGHGAWEPTAARPDSQEALLQQLRAWGLPTVEAPRLVRGAEAMWRAVKALGRERAGYPFPTDGAVVKLNSTALQELAGVTTQAPLWAMACKFVPARAETRIRAITLPVGRTGVLTPVAELVPVQVGGSTVTRASLYNRDEIARRDIRVGDFVYIEKAGEIIPAIASVNLARRTKNVVPFVFPSSCPVCRTALAQAAGEVAVRCPNYNCPAQVRRRVEHFVSKACVDIPGLGPAMVARLVAKGWVKNVADLYRLRRDDLLILGADVGKSTDRLLAAIEQSKHAELWRFIHGLGIPTVGEIAAHDLARHFGGLEMLAQAKREDFLSDGDLAIPRLGEKTAQAVLVFFRQPTNRTLLSELLASGVRPVPPVAD